MSPSKEKEWWLPRLRRWGKTGRGGVIIVASLIGSFGGALGFGIYQARRIATYLDLPGRAARHEVADSLLFEMVGMALARDSTQEARTLYYYRAMHCIHDGYEDTAEFLDCPHFREELIAMLAKAEGRAGPVGGE